MLSFLAKFLGHLNDVLIQGPQGNHSRSHGPIPIEKDQSQELGLLPNHLLPNHFNERENILENQGTSCYLSFAFSGQTPKHYHTRFLAISNTAKLVIP